MERGPGWLGFEARGRSEEIEIMKVNLEFGAIEPFVRYVREEASMEVLAFLRRVFTGNGNCLSCGFLSYSGF